MAKTTKKTTKKATGKGKSKVSTNGKAPKPLSVFKGSTGKTPPKKRFAIVGWDDSYAVPIPLDSLNKKVPSGVFYEEFTTMKAAKKAAIERNEYQIGRHQEEMEIIEEAICAIDDSPEAVEDLIHEYGLPRGLEYESP